MPVPTINNIVSTAQIVASRMPLDLDLICKIIPASSYDKRRFAAMTIRLANPNCTLLLFSSGKLVVTGGKHWYESVLSCLYISRLLRDAMPGTDFRVKTCDIQNIVANVILDMRDDEMLDLHGMYTRLNINCMYQNKLFPGLIYRPKKSPVVLLCFFSGKIVITGGKTIRDVHEGWKRLWPTVRVFIKKRQQASAAQA
jgi:transcription initiation factor TFIID TATA-box-binding protein